MRKLDSSKINWKEIQDLHDSGVFLNEIGVSRKMINLGVKEGLFVKRDLSRSHKEESKKKISEGRKNWLKENPDLHPWRAKDKFVSVPCQKLKEFLKEKSIDFEEEVIISSSKNYSVDLLFPSRNLILEINGNQHYDREGNLKPYYQERHNHIVSLGWKVLEIHYSTAFNFDLCLKLINETEECSSILPFRKRIKKELKFGGIKGYAEYRRSVSENKYKGLADKLKDSDIDFSKFGWVNEASKVIGLKPQNVNRWMKRYMPEFYEEKCFKRKS
jgi:very-short-patch-repair endonuclease